MKSFGILLIVACLAAAEQSPDVACPSSVYSWQHVKSLIATEKAGIFQFYIQANQKALRDIGQARFRAVASSDASVSVITAGTPRSSQRHPWAMRNYHA